MFKKKPVSNNNLPSTLSDYFYLTVFVSVLWDEAFKPCTPTPRAALSHGASHGVGPSAGGGPLLGKLDVSEKCWGCLAPAEPGHKCGTSSVQNECC